MKRIFIILMLFGLILNTFAQTELERDIIKANDELSVRDTSIIELIEQHTSGATIDGSNGLSKSGSYIELGGTLDQNTDIAGASYNINLGTTGSKINTFTVNGQNVAINSDNDIVLTASGISCTWDGSILVCGADTIATLADIRSEISDNKAVLPFNFKYTFDASTTDSRPGAGYFRLNNATLASVTYIYIDYYDNDNISQDVFLSAPDTGSYIAVKTDLNNFALYQLIGDLTDGGNYFKYRVSYEGHNGVISGLSTIDLDLSNNVGGVGGGVDSSLVSSTNQIDLVLDTLRAENEHGAFKTINVLDSIGINGDYFDGFDDSENLIIDSITTNNFSLNGSDYLDTIYSLADIGTSIVDAVEGSEFDNITTDSVTVGYAITDSVTTGLLRSSGYIIAGDAVHLFHYFGDSTISLSYTTSWQQLTNAWGEMWIYDEDDGFTVSGDTITITESGDYDFYCKNACSNDLNETLSIRFYNVTQALGVPVAGAVTGEGSGDFQSLPTSGYQDIDAGDKIVMQYKGDASGTAVFKSGVVKIYKIHE